MAVTTQEIEMLGCDAESCEVKAPAVDGRIPEKFEAGLVHPRYVDDKPVAWVACRKTHISAAVLAAKARALAGTADPAEVTQPDDSGPEVAQAQPGDDEPVRGSDDEHRRHEEDELAALGA